MGLTLGERPLHPFTVDAVMRMVDAGLLDDARVELLEGALVQASPKSPRHTAALTLLDRWLLPVRVAGRHEVRIEQPLVVRDPTSLPEPDLAVVERSDDLSRHPSTALLVIEIAVSTLAADTAIKPGLYASAGVPEYWVVDVAGRRLEVRRDPAGNEYRRLEVLGPDDVMSPLELDLPPLALTALLA